MNVDDLESASGELPSELAGSRYCEQCAVAVIQTATCTSKVLLPFVLRVAPMMSPGCLAILHSFRPSDAQGVLFVRALCTKGSRTFMV